MNKIDNEHKGAKTEETSQPKDSGRIDRIADQTKGLVEDIKEWVDLRVQLIQFELEEKFETVANQLLSTFLVLILAFITLMFALVAASLGIGKLLGDPLWGFLVVTGVLALATIIVRLARPKFISAPWTGSGKETKALKEERPEARLPQTTESSNITQSDGSGVEKE